MPPFRPGDSGAFSCRRFRSRIVSPFRRRVPGFETCRDGISSGKAASARGVGAATHGGRLLFRVACMRTVFFRNGSLSVFRRPFGRNRSARARRRFFLRLPACAAPSSCRVGPLFGRTEGRNAASASPLRPLSGDSRLGNRQALFRSRGLPATLAAGDRPMCASPGARCRKVCGLFSGCPEGHSPGRRCAFG